MYALDGTNDTEKIVKQIQGLPDATYVRKLICDLVLPRVCEIVLTFGRRCRFALSFPCRFSFSDHLNMRREYRDHFFFFEKLIILFLPYIFFSFFPLFFGTNFLRFCRSCDEVPFPVSIPAVHAAHVTSSSA